jgi:glucose/arabinose dehydrogenase
MRKNSLLKRLSLAAAIAVASLAGVSPALAQKAPKAEMYKPDLAAEAGSYKIITLPIPEDITLEVGGIECMPDGTLLVGTRRGDIYKVENAYADDLSKVKFTKWATGLHEVLGMAYNPKDGFLYACTRQDITRLKDRNNDGTADVYEVFCDGWAITGDYHEYGFMSPFDKDGNIYVVLCLTGSFSSKAPWRGWAVKITPDGKMHPFASGIRSPGGIGFDANGDVYYTDNQGPWNGTSSFKHLKFKSFQGHPGGNGWYDLPLVKNELGPRPKDPQTKSRIWQEMEKIPEFVPPPIWLPHVRVGQSASGICADLSGGKFGPFAGQTFVGDQHHSNIMRVVLEDIEGRRQGAAIPFRYGFASGVLPMKQAPDGSMWVGGTNRGWGSVGPKQFSLERVVFTGKPAFEIHTMKVKPDGFELTFTEPVDPKTAADPASYRLEAYSYIYQADYGSPEVDQSEPKVVGATVLPGGKGVRLKVEGMKIGSVHELRADGLKNAAGAGLLHPVAYYTLWAIPKTETAARDGAPLQQSAAR